MQRWGVLGVGFISNKMIKAVKASDGPTLHVSAGRTQTALDNGIPKALRPSPPLQDSLEIMAFLTEWDLQTLAS